MKPYFFRHKNILFTMNQIFNDIFNLNPRYSTTIGFIVALLLIDNLNAAEQNLVGNWFELVGQTILTNAASQTVIESRATGNLININSKEIKCVYNPPVYDIKKIKQIINQFYPNNKDEVDIIMKSLKELQKKVEELKKE